MMKTKYIIGLMMFAFSSVCTAQIREIVAFPTEWRVDNTADGGIQVYYTGSVCTHGKIKISSTADSSFKNRFWALMMAVKTAKMKVQVFYDDAQDCEITNFILPRESEPLVTG